MSKRFTRDEAANELNRARIEGKAVGLATPIHADYATILWLNPHFELNDGWSSELHYAWKIGFERGREARRAELAELAEAELKAESA